MGDGNHLAIQLLQIRQDARFHPPELRKPLIQHLIGQDCSVNDHESSTGKRKLRH